MNKTKSFSLFTTHFEGWRHIFSVTVAQNGYFVNHWDHRSLSDDVQVQRGRQTTTAFNDCVRNKHRQPAQSAKIQQRYWENKLKGDAKASKDRGLGHTVIYSGDNFGDVLLDGHHITDSYVIYIPRDFHRGCYTGDREQHRVKVWRELRINHYAIYKIIESLYRLHVEGYRR